MSFTGSITIFKDKFMFQHVGNILPEFFMGNKPVMDIINLIETRGSGSKTESERKNGLMFFEKMRNDGTLTNP